MLVAAVAVCFALAGVVVYLTRPTTYAAEAGALLQDPQSTIDNPSNTSNGDATRYVANQVAIMKSNELLLRASARMQGLPDVTALTPNELERSMTITPDQASSWVTVRVAADDAATAKAGADSVVDAYRVMTTNGVAAETQAALKKLDRSIAAVTRLMAKPRRSAAQQATALALVQQLRARRNRIEVNGELAGDGVALFAPAESAKRQGAPLFASTLIGLILGCLIGFGIAYLIDAVKGRSLAVEAAVGPTPLPAAVPNVPAPATVEGDGLGPIAAETGAETVAERERRWA
jgi:capsular polysaccharide biosynthesis protein